MSDSEDDFEVFNQPLSPKNTLSDLNHSFPVQSSQQQGTSSIPDDMGIQRKLRATLQELLEAQLGGNAPGKAPQAKLPTPPPHLHLPCPSDLNLLTSKGSGGPKVKRWCKLDELNPLRRMRPKGWPSYPKWGKGVLRGGVIL